MQDQLQEQKVTVTLEELKLSLKEIGELDLIITELPHKYAKPIYDFINKKLEEQLKAKAEKVQTELQHKTDSIKSVD